MPTKIWNDDDAAGVDTNWTTGANWVGGVAPVASDNVVVNAGSRNITGGLDVSAISLGNVYFGPDFLGHFGNSNSDQLILDANKVVIDGGGGGHFLKTGGGGVTDLIVSAVGASKVETLSLTATVTIPRAFFERGTVRLESGTITRAMQRAFSGIDSLSLLEVLDGTITDLYKGQGVARILKTSSSGVITTAHVSAGLLEALAGQVVNATLYGGTLDWRCNANMTALINLAGIFDGSQNGYGVTIATLDAFNGATTIVNPNTTVTTERTFNAFVKKVLAV